MIDSLWLIPLLPLASGVLLILGSEIIPRRLASIMGAGSVGLAALCTAAAAMGYLSDPQPVQQTLWTWMALGDFRPGVAFHFDGLTLVMMSVITGVGFLIHLYSVEFMAQDASFHRYFAYMNLFVASMLVLVMADNMVLLYLGWEGVGACSYLLVGFWYRDPANGAAARKAFVVTRIGDTAMALGLFLLLAELGTLNIQAMLELAPDHFSVGDPTVVLATFLLLGGAVGKSAQLPLHTWLPDAMAGPTPVSALIHAATMVTAGVYLVARTHGLFLLAPTTLETVAVIGVVTALVAAFTALVQTDIKRILAYSTISQIGYMFLGLGVGAWSAGIFHLMTHAFFKALLFLAAGAVIHCLHHEHNIFRMGGLRTRLPVVFWSFVIGGAALAALPYTSGFFSKDAILLSAWEVSPWLWLGGLLGAALTAFYTFRLVFVVFFGEAHTEPDKQPGWRMAVPLSVLCILSIIGGWFSIPVVDVFPAASAHAMNHTVEYISIGVPIIGVAVAWAAYLGGLWSPAKLVAGKRGAAVGNFLFNGWRIDSLYDRLWVGPYAATARLLRGEPVDALYNVLVTLTRSGHRLLAGTQSGQIRRYATVLGFGLVLLVAMVLRNMP